MAWKKPTATPKKADPSFPDPNYGKGTSIQYEELQQNELIALEAIYGEDFRRIKQTQTAWQVSAAIVGFHTSVARLTTRYDFPEIGAVF